MAAHLVIVDSELNHSACGHCSGIETLAQEAFSSSVRVTRMPDFRAIAGPEPDMVILRSPSRGRLPELLKPLRELWRSAPVIAAVCKIPHDAAELLDSCHAGLDDFFSCPF